jgi:adenylosuccinate synthase
MASVTVVVGGQYGSEGKGKVAQYLAVQEGAAAVVRVGGSNSGHTGFVDDERLVLRHLPTAALLPDVLCVLGPGSYVDAGILLSEVDRINLDPSRLIIDEKAFLITPEDRDTESRSGQIERIGSTGSGTGASVQRRIARRLAGTTVRDVPELQDYVADSTPILRELLNREERIVLEGTQGFGLSVLHASHYPYATSRDTTAASVVSESGLSPLDVDEVVLVLRAYPIRVAGDSGPLPGEIDWATVTSMSGHERPLKEFTSVTGRRRRVAHFDPEVVRRAIAVNRPSMIVMNHVDYVDAECVAHKSLTPQARRFVQEASEAIGAAIDLVGIGPTALLSFAPSLARVAY